MHGTNEIRNKEIEKRLAALGVKVPRLLLPKSGIDLSKWAVIACDQHTQDRAYWEAVEAETKGVPSTLNLIFPEICLSAPDRCTRINAIHSAMQNYINDGVFAPPLSSMVYIERATPSHPCRRGLVLAVDLEHYDWKPGRQTLIRSTEETIEERLPPRMEIRRNAPLEMPHTLLLMDDEKNTLLPAIAERVKSSPPLYSARLMMNSGSVCGWALDSDEGLGLLADGIEELKLKAGEDGFLFAVGDGNHSLATAKAIWTEIKNSRKSETAIEDHPARWALVELENLYDPGISFEPIHRIVFEAEPFQLHKILSASAETAEGRILRIKSEGFTYAAFQSRLDDFVKKNGFEIDYIHGEDELFRLAENSTRPAAGILMPPVNKNDLFKTVAKNGPLPRKSFSMGAAVEKRFYIECRRIFE